MTTGPRIAALLLVSLLAGCDKGGESPAKDSPRPGASPAPEKAEQARPGAGGPAAATTTATTATATAATAAATAAAAPAAAGEKYSKLTADQAAELTKKIMKGHTVHEAHSFNLSLKNFSGSVLSTTGPEGKTLVFHFFDQSGKRVTSVFDKDRDKQQVKSLLAVALEDVDRDGNEDLVAVAQYDGGSGVSVFTRSGAGPFAFNSALSKKGGKAATMPAALAALR